MSRVRSASASFVTSLAAVIVLAACATNPATGKRQFSLMSEEQELAIGREQDLQVRKEMGSYDNRELQQYVTTIGMKLAQVSERPNLPWHFTDQGARTDSGHRQNHQDFS